MTRITELNSQRMCEVFHVWHKAGRFWAASGYWWELLDYIRPASRARLRAEPGYEFYVEGNK